MRIGLVRHFPVRQEFMKGFVTQSEVFEWFERYNRAEIEIIQSNIDGCWAKCYTSEMPRAIKTAEHIYGGEIIKSGLLNEPMPNAPFKKNIKMPFLLWALVIRVCIMRNHKSQQQCKSVLQERIREFVLSLTHENEDLLVVSHAFTMEIMSEMLLQNGYTGKKLRQPKHGELFVFERK